MPVAATHSEFRNTTKDRSCLLEVICRYIELLRINTAEPALVLGGEQDDIEVLQACGFRQIVLSNLSSQELPLDAEDILLPENSYPVVFAHAVLHHCRSPQKALGEMLRVSRRHVFFVEPNDSAALRLLGRLGFSFPFELAAVAAHQYARGGLRDGPIPNYIYRWTAQEVRKSVAAYHPERQFEVHPHRYWDFYVNEYELLQRRESRVAALAQQLGPRTFLRLLRVGQSLLNSVGPLRAQGNKFFCAVTKRDLQPWIELQDGRFQMKREPLR